MIYIGADHRGFKLKECLKDYLGQLGYAFEDDGAFTLGVGDDYPDFALPVALKVAENPEGNRGVLVCGSGVGVDVAANKIDGVRSVLALSLEQVVASKREDDTNVLSLAADYTGEEDAKQIMATWLNAVFSKEEKHVRRLKKVSKIEEGRKQK